MAATLTMRKTPLAARHRRAAVTEPRWVRWLLTGVAIGFLAFFLLLPLGLVFAEAFGAGFKEYGATLANAEAFSAIRLTLLVALIVVPINTVFGVVAAWAIAKFEFIGKSLLITLIDLPYSISPVVAGMLFVLLFGQQGWFGAWLYAHDVSIVFSTTGIVIATLFVTFPFVARELIPLMQAQGTDEEEAARLLGASGWQTFRRVTLPNVKWALLYGIILCNARTMGEFGAVSVVAGHRASTNTMPLHIQALWEGGVELMPAFAVASLLAMLALVTLVLKSLLQWKTAEQLSADELGYTGD